MHGLLCTHFISLLNQLRRCTTKDASRARSTPSILLFGWNTFPYFFSDLPHPWTLFIFIYLLLSFLHLLTCVCIPRLSLPPPRPYPCFRQNLFRPLVLQFCRRQNIKDSKKDMVFLLIWDKDSYTESCFHLHVYCDRYWFLPDLFTTP
jgi:hypothetical protein